MNIMLYYITIKIQKSCMHSLSWIKLIDIYYKISIVRYILSERSSQKKKTLYIIHLYNFQKQNKTSLWG